ncbi:MAG: ArsA-related P-loop ATPase [Bdellovibrionales bacterium]
MSNENIDNILKSKKVIICVGSGGVGKTTISAALGIRAAQIGLKVLVMTIDPSKRLKVALGLTSDDYNVKVPGQNYSGELRASILDAEKLFNEFVLDSSSAPESTQMLFKNSLYKQLSTTLSGSQEFTSLLQLAKVVHENEFDLIILDTPPAQHAVDFLESPEKITDLFQEKIIKWLTGDSENVGIVQRFISRGTHTILKTLEMVTGNVFMKELNDFFVKIRFVQKKISDRSEQVQSILTSDTTAFMLVTGFDLAKLKEAEFLREYLVRKKYALQGVIINRAYSPILNKENLSGENDKLIAEFKKWHDLQVKRQLNFDAFEALWHKKLPVVRISDLNEDIVGLVGLEGIAEEVTNAFSQK